MNKYFLVNFLPQTSRDGRVNDRFVQYLDYKRDLPCNAWDPAAQLLQAGAASSQHPAALLGCKAEEIFRCTIWCKRVASPRSLALCQCKPELGKSWASLLWLQLKSSTGSRSLLFNKCEGVRSALAEAFVFYSLTPWTFFNEGEKHHAGILFWVTQCDPHIY